MNNKSNNSLIINGIDVEKVIQQNKYRDNITFSEFWANLDERLEESVKSKTFISFQSIWKLALGSIALIIIAIIGVFQLLNISKINNIVSGNVAFVSRVKGNVFVKEKNSNSWKAINPNEIIIPLQNIKTSSNSFCELQISNKGIFFIGPSTETYIASIKDKENKGYIDIRLSIGEIFVKAFHLKSGEILQVLTPSARARVTGTKFFVTTDKEGNTKVGVNEGRVKVAPISTSLIEAKEKSLIDDNTYNTIEEKVLSSVEINASESIVIESSNSKKLNNAIASVLESKISEAEEKHIIPDEVFYKNIKNTIRNSFKLKQEEKVKEDSGITPLIFKKSNLTTEEKDIFKRLESGKSLLSEMIPGQIIWKENISLPYVNKDGIIYQSRIYLTTKNRLKILTTDGNLLKSIEVTDSDSTLTRPAKGNNRLYIGADNGNLFAYSMEGEILWKDNEAGKCQFNSYPVSQNNIVVVASIDRGIKVYSEDGKLIHQIKTENDEPIYATPLLLNNGKIIIYGTEKGHITAYDLENRNTIWKNAIDDRIVYPIVGDEYSIAVLMRNSGNIIAFDTKTGKQIWSKTINQLKRTEIIPVYKDEKLIIAGENSIFVINSHTGSEILHLELDDAISHVSELDNKIIVGFKNKKLIQYDISTGNIEWSTTAESGFRTFLVDKKAIYTISDSSWSKISR